MDNFTADFTYQIPRDVYYQLVHTLRAALPAPVSDDPADLVRRDNAMIGRIAAMLPANADEASVAAQCVAADAQALECLRLAHTLPRNLELALKCGAQAISMMREARSARTLLLRLQAARQKREADSTTLDKANWVEHSALGLMAQALGRDPGPPMAEPQPPPELEPQAPPAEAQAEAATDLAADAECNAIIYPPPPGAVLIPHSPTEHCLTTELMRRS